MPFNPSGIFQRLFSWRADRDAGVEINAEKMDQEFDGLVDGINSIIQGGNSFKGPITTVAGGAGTPAFSFEADPDTGIYRSASDEVGVAAGGNEVLTLSSALANFSAPIKTSEIRSEGAAPVVVSAGHSFNFATGQTGEFVYLNAENGVQVTSSPDNWGSGWAARQTTTITGSGITIDGNEVLHEGNVGTFALDAATLGGVAAFGYARTDAQEQFDEFVGFYRPSSIVARFGSPNDISGGAGINTTLEWHRSDGQGRSAYMRAEPNLFRLFLDNNNTDFIFRDDGQLEIDGARLLKETDTLDADTLGGQNSAFHRNASNLNAGVVSAARLDIASQAEALAGTNSTAVMSPLRVKQAIDSNAPDLSNINAATFDGQDSPFFRNAANLDSGKLQPSRLTFATNPEALAGTNSTSVMSPLLTRQAIEGRQFESGQLTLSTNQTLTITHGLGARPHIVQCALRCVTANNGYAVGDEMIIASTQQFDGSGIQVRHNSAGTQIRIEVGVNGIQILSVSTNTRVTLLTAQLANWRLIARAQL